MMTLKKTSCDATEFYYLLKGNAQQFELMISFWLSIRKHLNYI